MMRSPAQPGPVPLGIGDPQRTAAVERHHPVKAEPHPWCRRPGQQPGKYLEQRPHRRAADPSAQVTQRLRRRMDHRHPGQAHGQLVPDQPVADLREQAHRQQEVDPDPRRQIAQPSLYRPRLRKDRVHELERHNGSQLAQMPGSERACGHSDRTGDSRQRKRQDTMTGQRSSFGTSCLGRLPVPTSSVALRREPCNSPARPAKTLTTRPWVKARPSGRCGPAVRPGCARPCRPRCPGRRCRPCPASRCSPCGRPRPLRRRLRHPVVERVPPGSPRWPA